MAPKRKVFSSILISFLAITLMLFITTFALSMAKGAHLTKQISDKYGMINKFVSKGRIPITKDSVIFLIEERNRLRNVYTRFKMAFITPMTKEIPEESMDPLKFKEQLVQTQKKLREVAERHNLELPGSLGFTKYETELSSASEIPVLIKRLRVIEELISFMTFSGVDSLNEINFIEEPVKKEEAPTKVIGLDFDIPLSFKINCTASELVDFLYRLRVSHFNFITDDIDMKKIGATSEEDATPESILEVGFLIKAVAIK